MSKVFLHVGLHKTGSTTIQEFLETSREKCIERGLHYLAGPEANHSLFVLSAFEENAWEIHGVHYRSTFQKALYFGDGAQESNLKKFTRSARKAAEINVDAMISGEAMYHLTHDGMRRFKDFLYDHFDDVEIVGFVRPPLDFATSYVQEVIKTRATLEALKSRPPAPNYKMRLGKYADVFGKDRMKIRPFDRSHFPDGSSLREIMRMCAKPDIDELAANNPAHDENRSMSDLAFKVVASVNRHARDLSFDDFNNQILIKAIGIRGDALVLSSEMARAVVEASKTDVAWLRESFGIDFNMDEANLGDYPIQEGPLSFSAEDMVRVVRAMTVDASPPKNQHLPPAGRPRRTGIATWIRRKIR